MPGLITSAHRLPARVIVRGILACACLALMSAISLMQPASASVAANLGQDKGEPPYWRFNWDYVTAQPLAPACTRPFPLTVLPSGIEDIVSLNRLGYTQPGSHALPVPHHNIATRDLRGSGTVDENGALLVSERVDPLVSPGNLTITALARNTYQRNATTKESSAYQEWMIVLHVCGTKYIVLNHVDDIPKAWVKATKGRSVRKECTLGQDSAEVCMYSYLRIPVKAGQRIGRASGRSAGWDIGAWDTAKPTPGVLDPGKWTGRWATGTCVWDWFTPAIRNQVFTKFVGDTTSCGTHGHDLPDSLSGVWLALGQRDRASTEDLHIALIPSYRNDGTHRFSIGFQSVIPSLPGGIYEFRGESSGLRNPDFTRVRPGEVACFDSFDDQYRHDSAITRIYASMSAGTTERITIAGQRDGACGPGPYTMPAGAAVFERRASKG